MEKDGSPIPRFPKLGLAQLSQDLGCGLQITRHRIVRGRAHAQLFRISSLLTATSRWTVVLRVAEPESKEMGQASGKVAHKRLRFLEPKFSQTVLFSTNPCLAGIYMSRMAIGSRSSMLGCDNLDPQKMGLDIQKSPGERSHPQTLLFTIQRTLSQSLDGLLFQEIMPVSTHCVSVVSVGHREL